MPVPQNASIFLFSEPVKTSYPPLSIPYFTAVYLSDEQKNPGILSKRRSTSGGAKSQRCRIAVTYLTPKCEGCIFGM